MSNFGQVCAARGRPKKKPGYCKDKEIEKLIKQAVRLYGPPYDDREGRSEDDPTLATVAEQMGTTSVRVRKLLITAGNYSTHVSRKVQHLFDAGNSIEEICESTGLGTASVWSYLPYLKGAYKLEDPTLHAEQIRLFRRRKKASEELQQNLDKKESEQYLWTAIIAFEKYPFQISCFEKDAEDDKKPGTFQYSICNDEMCISGVKFSKETIMKAFRRARKIQAAEGCVDRSERLGCIGARELYAVFLRIGAISDPAIKAES